MFEYNCVSYLKPLMKGDTLKEITTKLVARLKKSRRKFDAVAFRGLSGGLIAPMLAAELDLPLIAVRKSKNDNHSYRMVECGGKFTNYIIVDDQISTGETVKAIRKEISEVTPESNLVGVILYLPVSPSTAGRKSKICQVPVMYIK